MTVLQELADSTRKYLHQFRCALSVRKVLLDNLAEDDAEGRGDIEVVFGDTFVKLMQMLFRMGSTGEIIVNFFASGAEAQALAAILMAYQESYALRLSMYDKCRRRGGASFRSALARAEHVCGRKLPALLAAPLDMANTFDGLLVKNVPDEIQSTA